MCTPRGHMVTGASRRPARKPHKHGVLPKVCRKSQKINKFFKGFHIAFFREYRYNMNQDGRLGGDLLFPRYLNPKV